MTTVPFSRARARKLKAARANGLSRADRTTARDHILAKGQSVTVGDREYMWLHTGTLQFQVDGGRLGGRVAAVSNKELQDQHDSGTIKGPFVTKGTLVRTSPEQEQENSYKKMLYIPLLL